MRDVNLMRAVENLRANTSETRAAIIEPSTRVCARGYTVRQAASATRIFCRALTSICRTRSAEML